MSKKNCLLISQHFYPEEFIINDIVTESLNLNFEVITTYPSYPKLRYYKSFYKNHIKKKKFNKVKIYRVFTFPRFFNNFINILLNYLSFILFGIMKLIFKPKKKIDFIFVFATSPLYQALIGLVAKKIFKKKLVVWVQDLWPESLIYTGYIKNKFILNILKKISLYIYNSSDLLIAQSKELEQYIRKQTNTKTLTLANPSRDFFLKKKKTINLKIKIGYAGNFGKVQNLKKIISIAEILSKRINNNILFYFIGDGSEKSNLIKIINKKKINNVLIKNKVSTDKINFFYSEMDVLVINSNLKGKEAVIIPSKLQSYLSTSKPIISFCEGSVKKIIKLSKSGIDLSNKSNQEAANEIIKLTTNKKKMLKLAQNGRRYYMKNYDLKIFIKKFNNIINKNL